MTICRWKSLLAWLLPIALTLVGLGCGGDGLVKPWCILIVTPEELLDAPSRLTFGGHTYELQTFLWRNFQPICPPDGDPLIALVWLVEADSLSIPEDVTIDFLWVVNGDVTWATEFSSEARPPQPAYILEKVARGGPKWGPGIAVDVVVRVRTGSGDTYRILAAQQAIHRTD